MLAYMLTRPNGHSTLQIILRKQKATPPVELHNNKKKIKKKKKKKKMYHGVARKTLGNTE